MVGPAPAPLFSTLGSGVDMPTNPAETLMPWGVPGHSRQAVQAAATEPGFRMYDRALIMENKWRAARYGIDGLLD